MTVEKSTTQEKNMMAIRVMQEFSKMQGKKAKKHNLNITY
jgi:hypothetical protein